MCAKCKIVMFGNGLGLLFSIFAFAIYYLVHLCSKAVFDVLLYL